VVADADAVREISREVRSDSRVIRDTLDTIRREQAAFGEKTSTILQHQRDEIEKLRSAKHEHANDIAALKIRTELQDREEKRRRQ
jgi:hypothetical protein